ncbi:MAG: hypothetical protein ACJ0J2_07025 [Dehalococcoidia bacterium]|nr:MAG: hypothetical protein CBC30_00975 [Chloroflexi bacterium TMED70]|tara:strand:- start:21307 stop:21960 length:654 start_codon:yes stop_codon:yes gene_type:complete
MFDFIGVAIGILFAILIISGIIFLIGYAFKSTGVKISFDISLNGYFYFVRLISGGVFCLAGISRILQGIFAMIFGNSFSFQLESYTSDNSEEMLQMFNGSVEASLFTGITTAIISGIIFLVHARLQSKNELSMKQDPSKDIIFKMLVFAGTIFFGLVTIVGLVGSIEELYKFILFDSVKNVEDWRKGVPGEPLSIALSALIGWTITLRRLIRLISKK